MPGDQIVICGSVQRFNRESHSDLAPLSEALDRISLSCSAEISSPFELTHDGFRGTALAPAPLRRVLLFLEGESGLSLRFGIALGDSDADSALSAAETRGAFHTIHIGFSTPECEILDATAHSVLTGMRSATARQREAVESFDSLGKEVAVAEEMGISQPAVNKMLASADGKRLLKSADAYIGFLDSLRRSAWSA